MNKLLIFIFCIASGFHAMAQGKVEIFTDPEIESMENNRVAKRKANEGKVKGYRIMVGFYSSRNAASDKLAEARNYFGSQFGALILFEEPNFKVYVGEFTSRTDAENALTHIRKKYPGARIIDDMVVPPRFR